MTSPATVAEQVEQQGVLTLECSIPEDMTIDEWRRRRSRAVGRRLRRRRSRTPAAARHLASVPDADCDHLHDATSRYDRSTKLLTFLLVCHECGTERVIETLRYEPRFEPYAEALAA